ncbi:hypothetical protein CA223_12640 [Sphingomonas koreensis]|jgi:hypothetical protein|uniref:Heme exporter protein D n=1 Tax=Sphingomonas koreensis TaxID=93064 RepID=A0A1L6J8V3_9SPHN|nr:hypothetical protein [Sphingomonas koreensis]APR52363.1 hypothetical protein BRX40_07905 [Sphingomonas koreensis]MDC7811515.1 hypothetical protein [Sphingomonas koreensis]PJI88177.1 hypothetical protein BDW16_1442 [Sphingomonas koreensis]RSU19747.1 hypothetical protein CA224_11890 [Sphingomonas koreensis]RSU26535.1 hypothetical protein CA222_09605 [Sphingomonas koreensis]
MADNAQSISLTSDPFAWVTTTHFVVIGLCALGAIAILIWGRHLRRKRQEADAELEGNNEIVEGETRPPEP